MRRWIAMAAMAQLFAGAAAADPAKAPFPDLAVEWSKAVAGVDGKTDSALRHHKAAAEADRDAAGCSHGVASPAAQGTSASERHRRLTACLAQLRARDELLARNQP